MVDNQFLEDDDIFNYINQNTEIVEEELIGVTPLPPSVLKPKADLKFTDLYNRTLPVREVYMNPDGQIEKLILSEPVNGQDIYYKGDFFIIKELLEVPGVGRLSPGTMVRYEGKDYLLLYGWHTNLSNQTIYSWYLTKDKECHTLYQDMIDKINLIRIG